MTNLPFERVPEPTSAKGDFYVDSNGCTSCGVPQVAAPDLVGWTDEKHPQCRWMKQPESTVELHQAFAVFDGQELGCHRYAGTDPKIQERIGLENCDYPLPSLQYHPQADPPTPRSWERLAALFKKLRKKR